MLAIGLACILLIGIVYVESSKTESFDALNMGSSGEQVKKLQQELKNQGFYKGTVDGVYGNGTVEAVRNMQKAYGLTVDGIAGSGTLSALGISSDKGNNGKGENASGGHGGYSEADVYLLARTIHAEARGEPYEGKVAVGAVILNRVKSKEFPNTISGVVYEPWAFTAVNDGQINLEPNAECIQAAKDAINGWDPSYGCLFYYNPVKATSKWIFTTKTVTTIGSHVFSI